MASSTQDHIHLGTTLGTDNAPDETYGVSQRQEAPAGFLKLARNLNGTLITHILTSGGNPIIKTGYNDVLLVTMAELITIKALIGKQVYFVDNYHPDAGTDHTSSVKTMRFKSVSNIRNLDPMLAQFIAQLTLEEV